MDGSSTWLASHENLANDADTRGPDEQQRADAEEADRLSNLKPRAGVGHIQKECDRHDCQHPGVAVSGCYGLDEGSVKSKRTICEGEGHEEKTEWREIEARIENREGDGQDDIWRDDLEYL